MQPARCHRLGFLNEIAARFAHPRAPLFRAFFARLVGDPIGVRSGALPVLGGNV